MSEREYDTTPKPIRRALLRRGLAWRLLEALANDIAARRIMRFTGGVAKAGARRR